MRVAQILDSIPRRTSLGLICTMWYITVPGTEQGKKRKERDGGKGAEEEKERRDIEEERRGGEERGGEERGDRDRQIHRQKDREMKEGKERRKEEAVFLIQLLNTLKLPADCLVLSFPECPSFQLISHIPS